MSEETGTRILQTPSRRALLGLLVPTALWSVLLGLVAYGLAAAVFRREGILEASWLSAGQRTAVLWVVGVVLGVGSGMVISALSIRRRGWMSADIGRFAPPFLYSAGLAVVALAVFMTTALFLFVNTVESGPWNPVVRWSTCLVLVLLLWGYAGLVVRSGLDLQAEALEEPDVQHRVAAAATVADSLFRIGVGAVVLLAIGVGAFLVGGFVVWYATAEAGDRGSWGAAVGIGISFWSAAAVAVSVVMFRNLVRGARWKGWSRKHIVWILVGFVLLAVLSLLVTLNGIVPAPDALRLGHKWGRIATWVGG
jgi:hypothetical protein